MAKLEDLGEVDVSREEVEKILMMASIKVQEYTAEAEQAEQRAKKAYACAEVWRRLLPNEPKAANEKRSY